jgi:hypothetical protein
MVIADTSLDKFHETATAQRPDELARAHVHAVNTADEHAFDTVLARGFLSIPAVACAAAPPSRTNTATYETLLRISRLLFTKTPASSWRTT